VRIPTSAFPTDAFCAGKDSAVWSVSDAQGGGLQLQLSSLASGAGCATPRQGTLHGAGDRDAVGFPHARRP
jgi:hypothetical protein